MKKYIFFDLDGTITNPKEGITKSVQYTLRHMGIEVTDLDSLCKHIGPPLKDSFKEFWGFNEAEAETALIKYREYFTVTGIYENIEYEGIKELLEELKNAGRQIILATSKPENFAALILEHFKLDSYFSSVCGATMDGERSKKGDVIRYAIEKNGIKNVEDAVMVGDRLHDIAGARENHMDSIGVLYGFGDRKELEKAGAGFIAGNVEELKNIIFSL